MIEQIDHLSYSSITTYQMCPRSWRFHYLERVQTPTSPALIFGSAFHDAIEGYLGTGKNQNPLVEFWKQSWMLQLERNAENGINWGRDSEESMADLGVKMFSDPDTIALVDSLKPLVLEDQEPQVQIERRIELQVPGVPVPIVGYIDLIEADGVVCDFKTSARSWDQKKADFELQPIFYLAALNQAGYLKTFGGLPPKLHGWPFRHYCFIKTKKPQVQIWESYRTIGQMFWLFGLIKETWEAINAGAFPPNTTTFKCSPKYCEYWGICRGAA